MFLFTFFSFQNLIDTCVTVSIDVIYIYSCPNPLIPSVSPLCNMYIHHHMVLIPTSVLQTSKVYSNMHVWIHRNSIETWLQPKYLTILLHMFNINNEMSKSNIKSITTQHVQWLNRHMTEMKIHCNSKKHKQWNATIKHQIYSNSINLLLFMCVLFYSSFVCISAYANVYFKTTIMKQNIKIIPLQNNFYVSEVHCGSAVRFSQALPGYLITAHHLYASLM
jgi:hypothetical protein